MPIRLRSALTVVLAMGLGACAGSTDNDGGFRFAGDWCTLRTLSADGTPALSAAHMGGLFVDQGNRVLGSGAVKRPGDSILWPSRYAADVVGNTLLMEVTPLDGDPAAPRFALDLDLEGPNDLVGTVTGDAGFAGPIRLVRLGPRCFAQ